MITTLLGLGGFPGTHELNMGMPGMHGMYWNNMAISEADLLIGIGMRFDDRVTGRLKDFAPNAKIVHIDIDPAEIGKNIPPTVPIVGDVKQVLQRAQPRGRRRAPTTPGAPGSTTCAASTRRSPSRRRTRSCRST